SGDLIDLIEKYYSSRLHSLDGRSSYLIHVNEPLFFFLHEVLHRLIDAKFSTLRTSLKEIAQHVFHVDAHLFDTLWSGKFDDGEILFPHLKLNQTIVQLSAPKLRPELFTRTVKLFVSGTCVWFDGLLGRRVEIVKAR